MKNALRIRVINQNGWWSVTCPDLGIGGSGISEQEARIAFYRSFVSLATWAEKQKVTAKTDDSAEFSKCRRPVGIEEFVQGTLSTVNMSAAWQAA